MPAQVIRAAQWSIPIFLLARKPTDAALSWVIRQPGVPIRQALKHYISFYEKAAEYRDALVVGFFEEVTRDYGTVLEWVNTKFGTGFSSFVHSEDNVKCVFDRIEEVHRAMRGRLDEKVIAHPSAVKAGQKDALKKGLEAPEVRKLTTRAEGVYDSFGPKRTGPRTLGSRPHVDFYAAIDPSVCLVYGGVGQRPAGRDRAMMRPLRSSIS